jgi:hypothetical protein
MGSSCRAVEANAAGISPEQPRELARRHVPPRPLAPLLLGARDPLGAQPFAEPESMGIDELAWSPTSMSLASGMAWGRMCKVHWNAYTAGLARDAKARKAAVEGAPAESETPTPVEPKPARKRATPKSTPVASSQEDAD